MAWQRQSHVVSQKLSLKRVVETVVVEKPVTQIEKVVETVVVERVIEGETVKVVETVVVDREVTRVEKVIETVVVDREVTKIEKVVETVVVERQVEGKTVKVVETVVVERPVTKVEKVVETVVVEKVVVATAVPAAMSADGSMRMSPSGHFVVAENLVVRQSCSQRLQAVDLEFSYYNWAWSTIRCPLTPQTSRIPPSASGTRGRSHRTPEVSWTVRPGVQFHQGWGEVTAHDIAFSSTTRCGKGPGSTALPA